MNSLSSCPRPTFNLSLDPILCCLLKDIAPAIFPLSCIINFSLYWNIPISIKTCCYFFTIEKTKQTSLSYHPSGYYFIALLLFTAKCIKRSCFKQLLPPIRLFPFSLEPTPIGLSHPSLHLDYIIRITNCLYTDKSNDQ